MTSIQGLLYTPIGEPLGSTDQLVGWDLYYKLRLNHRTISAQPNLRNGNLEGLTL